MKILPPDFIPRVWSFAAYKFGSESGLCRDSGGWLQCSQHWLTVWTWKALEERRDSNDNQLSPLFFLWRRSCLILKHSPLTNQLNRFVFSINCYLLLNWTISPICVQRQPTHNTAPSRLLSSFQPDCLHLTLSSWICRLLLPSSFICSYTFLP